MLKSSDKHKSSLESATEYAHLSFLQLLMNKSTSATKAKEDEEFLPRDLGLRSSSSSSSRSSSSSSRSNYKEFRNTKESFKLNQKNSMRQRESRKSISLGVIKNNNNDEEQEPVPAPQQPTSTTPRKSIMKQSTLVNTDLDRIMVNDLLDKDTSPAKVMKSFNYKPQKEHWKLSIFELGKEQYHVFDNKMFVNYDIPIVPEDETVIL